METYYNANHAFNSLRADIIDKGIPFANTKALFNIGFYLQNPLDNKITNKERNWKEEYAEAEWQWYLSGDRNIKKLGDIYGKIPLSNIDNPIWDITGNVVEASFNIPLARIQRKLSNLKAASDSDNANWQRVALVAGWDKWGLGIDRPEEIEEAKEEVKQEKKEQKKQERSKRS